MSHKKIISVIHNDSKLCINYTYVIVYSINSYIFAELKYRNYEKATYPRGILRIDF